jgi:hypothetical protein
MICEYDKYFENLLNANLDDKRTQELILHSSNCPECSAKLKLIENVDTEIESHLIDFKYVSNKAKIMQFASKKSNLISGLSKLYKLRRYACAAVIVIIAIFSIHLLNPLLMNNTNLINYSSKGTPTIPGSSTTDNHNTVSEKAVNAIRILNLKDISSVKVQLSTAGASPAIEYAFGLNNPEQLKIVRNIIGDLNSGKVQGNTDEKVVRKGGTPTMLILKLKDGSVIQVKCAVQGKEISSNGLEGIVQDEIPDEVTIMVNTESPFRILSPELNKLIKSGYKDIFQTNSSSN